MAAFRVDQRVRVIACDSPRYSYTVGEEGIVNEVDCTNELGESGNIGVTLAFTNDVTGTCDGWCFFPHELEPLQPEGYQIVDWSECLWQPPKIQEGVA